MTAKTIASSKELLRERGKYEVKNFNHIYETSAFITYTSHVGTINLRYSMHYLC